MPSLSRVPYETASYPRYQTDFFEEKNIVLEELVRDSKGFEIARSDITRCDCIYDQRCQGAAVVPHAGPNSSEPHKFKRNNSLA